MGNWDVSKPHKDGEPCEDTVSRGVFEQVVWERDVAIDKLKELGYGFGEKIRTDDDSISRQASIAALKKYFSDDGMIDTERGAYWHHGHVIEVLQCMPSVTPKQRTGWIPFTYRPATDEEKKHYAERTGYDEEDIDTILNCQLPEDGETVLITDRLGNVEVDTFINDCDGCYFECNCDMEDVRAWMPLPKPYTEESEEQS